LTANRHAFLKLPLAGVAASLLIGSTCIVPDFKIWRNSRILARSRHRD
jgi:hypothetical protein